MKVSIFAEFAATQVTKQDIMKLMAIQEQARGEQCFRDSGGIYSSTFR